MQAIDIWNLLHLYRREVIVLLLALGLASEVQAQSKVKINLPNYDERFLHYGFSIGIHQSNYAIRYANQFASQQQDTLHSIVPLHTGGFKLGFISNFHLLQYLDFRFLINVGFYENRLNYRSVTGGVTQELLDATYVELPFLLKYKSVRRDNIGMYFVGGITPSFEARGKNAKSDPVARLPTKTRMLSIEAGVGFDMFYPLFKFSPEIRYSWGVTNLLNGDINKYSEPLKRVTLHTITLYITFEGGPS